MKVKAPIIVTECDKHVRAYQSHKLVERANAVGFDLFRPYADGYVQFCSNPFAKNPRYTTVSICEAVRLIKRRERGSRVNEARPYVYLPPFLVLDSEDFLSTLTAATAASLLSKDESLWNKLNEERKNICRVVTRNRKLVKFTEKEALRLVFLLGSVADLIGDEKYHPLIKEIGIFHAEVRAALRRNRN